MLADQADLCSFPEWHRKIAVQSTRRHYCNGIRIYHTFFPKTTAEEIPQWYLYSWIFFLIPDHLKYQVPKHKTVTLRGFVIYCNPNMINYPTPMYICQNCSTAWCNISKAWMTLSAFAQASRCHSSFTLFSRRIFPINGTGTAKLPIRKNIPK